MNFDKLIYFKTNNYHTTIFIKPKYFIRKRNSDYQDLVTYIFNIVSKAILASQENNKKSFYLQI